MQTKKQEKYAKPVRAADHKQAEEDQLLRQKAKIARISLYAMLICVVIAVLVYVPFLAWTPSEGIDESTLAATVNGKDITLEEVDSWMSFLNAQVRGTVQLAKEETIRQLITYELLLDEAKRGKVSVPDADVDDLYARYDQISQYALERILAEQDIAPYEFKEHIRNTLLIQGFYDMLTQGIGVSEEEIDLFIRDNQAFIDKQTEGKNLTEQQIRSSVEQTILDFKREETKKTYIDTLLDKADVRYYNEFSYLNS